MDELWGEGHLYPSPYHFNLPPMFAILPPTFLPSSHFFSAPHRRRGFANQLVQNQGHWNINWTIFQGRFAFSESMRRLSCLSASWGKSQLDLLPYGCLIILFSPHHLARSVSDLGKSVSRKVSPLVLNLLEREVRRGLTSILPICLHQTVLPYPAAYPDNFRSYSVSFPSI